MSGTASALSTNQALDAVQYRLVRSDGSEQEAQGLHSWEQILTSADVAEPGRIQSFGVTCYGRSLELRLGVEDRLIFRIRARPGNMPQLTRLIVGVRHPDGSTPCYALHENGALVWAPSVEAA